MGCGPPGRRRHRRRNRLRGERLGALVSFEQLKLAAAADELQRILDNERRRRETRLTCALAALLLGVIGLLRVIVWPGGEQLYGQHYLPLALTLSLDDFVAGLAGDRFDLHGGARRVHLAAMGVLAVALVLLAWAPSLAVTTRRRRRVLESASRAASASAARPASRMAWRDSTVG